MQGEWEEMNGKAWKWIISLFAVFIIGGIVQLLIWIGEMRAWQREADRHLSEWVQVYKMQEGLVSKEDWRALQAELLKHHDIHVRNGDL